MYPIHSIRQRLVAISLLLSLFLQSCGNQSIQPITSKPDKSATTTSSLSKTKLESDKSLEEPIDSTFSVAPLSITSSSWLVDNGFESTKDQLASELPVDSNSLQSNKTTDSALSQPMVKNEGYAMNSSVKQQPVSIGKLTQSSQSSIIKKNPILIDKRLTTSQKLAKVSREVEEQEEDIYIDMLADKEFTAKGGHQVSLDFIEGGLTAVVYERLPIGFTRASLSLPVYIEPGFKVADLEKYPSAWQEAHIEVIFPERTANGKGYVYIGKRGGLGGGNSGSSDRGGNDRSGSSKSNDRCTFRPNEKRPDPDNPGKYVCPGNGKHHREAPTSSSTSSSRSTNSSKNWTSKTTNDNDDSDDDFYSPRSTRDWDSEPSKSSSRDTYFQEEEENITPEEAERMINELNQGLEQNLKEVRAIAERKKAEIVEQLKNKQKEEKERMKEQLQALREQFEEMQKKEEEEMKAYEESRKKRQREAEEEIRKLEEEAKRIAEEPRKKAEEEARERSRALRERLEAMKQGRAERIKKEEEEAKKKAEETRKKAEKEAKRKAEEARQQKAARKEAQEKALQKAEAARKEQKAAIESHLQVCQKDAEFSKQREEFLVTAEKLKQDPDNKELQALHAEQLDKFQSHSLYQQSIELGMQAAELWWEAKQKAAASALPALGGAEQGIYDKEAYQEAQKYQEEADAVEKELLGLLRELLGCSNRPSGVTRAVAGIKGFVESFYDMGKLLVVDLPVLLGKLGIKGVESLVKWEDKLGIKEGCANLGEVCKVLFNETKQAWEDPAAYEARMQAVRELEKKQELFRFAFDAENYYLGQDRMLGYMMAEMVQIVFGGEILKGAAKGVSKGVQFVKEVQQGVRVEQRVVEGVKLVEEAAEGVKLMEGVKLEQESIKVGEYTYASGAAKHLDKRIAGDKVYAGMLDRSYMQSPQIIEEIIATGKGIPDIFKQGALKFEVNGTFRGVDGIWDLVIDPSKKIIYHFVFKGKK